MEENSVLTKEENEVTKEETLTFGRTDCILAYAVLILGFCFIRFVLWNVTGIITTAFFWVTAIICMIYLKKNGFKQDRSNLTGFGLVLVFSLVFSISANNFIKFLDIVFVLLLGIHWVYSVCRDNGRIGSYFIFDMLKAVYVMPFAGFLKTSGAIAYTNRRFRHSNNVKLAVLGFIAAIPLTVLVAELLTSADSGVERMLQYVLNGIDEDIMIPVLQMLMGIPVAFYLYGMLYSNVRREKAEIFTEEECGKRINRMKFVPNILLYSAVTPVCILYTMFFISQLNYFLSAFMGQLPGSYSFAEYARRGFFELCAVTVINLFIILAINLLSRQSGEDKPAILKIYSVMLTAFTLMIITTALSKMVMYICEYGLTRLRVYTSWFMVLLALTFILILIRQFKYRFHFARYLVTAFVLMFGILCFSRVDAMISRYNIDMYQAGRLKELDTAALRNLSEDGLLYALEQGVLTKGDLYYMEELYETNPYVTLNLSSFRVKSYIERDMEQ